VTWPRCSADFRSHLGSCSQANTGCHCEPEFLSAIPGTNTLKTSCEVSPASSSLKARDGVLSEMRLRQPARRRDPSTLTNRVSTDEIHTLSLGYDLRFVASASPSK
jgi:hypothetical protein